MRVSRTASKKRVQQIGVFASSTTRPVEQVVWWYGGLLKGAAGHQPRVQVWMRGIIADELTNDYHAIQVPIAELSLFPIGSIWARGTSQQSAALETCVFGVDFDPDGWQCFAPKGSAELEAAIPSSKYPLYSSFRHHASYLLRFAADFGTKGVTLLIPCLEFFSRMYGNSSAVRRTLVSFPWVDARTKLLRPLPRRADDGSWAVNLQRRCVNADVVFLAHLEHDEYALRQLKLLWGQLEAGFSKPGNTELPLRVLPWWRGRATLSVKGIWLDEGNTFLGLRIVGSSQPLGEPIVRGREGEAAPGRPAGGQDSGGPPGVKRVRSDAAIRIVDMTSELPPDHEASEIVVLDDRLEVLGRPREVKAVRHLGAYNQNMTYVARLDDGSDALYSSDEKMGKGKGVGSATFVAAQDFESLGTLREVWMYLNALRRMHPDFVESVAYLNKEGFFVESPEPELLSFLPFSQQELARGNVSNTGWPYLVPASKLTRGALVARVKTPTAHVYLFEIQRRLATSDFGGLVEAENFRGLAFTLPYAEQVPNWVRSLMHRTRFTLGRALNDVKDPPLGVARAFNHSPAIIERFPQEAAIRNAFRLVNVPLPDVASRTKQIKQLSRLPPRTRER